MTDVLPASSSAGVAAAASGDRTRILIWTFASIAMVLVLLAPTLWNGFPLIFPDSGGYLTRPIEGSLAMGRSALYGLFLYAGMPLSFWPIAVLQSALTVWLIVLTMRTQGLAGRPWLALSIVAVLTVGTSLPWFAGQLMPDILFFCAVLALYLLAFRSEQLVRWERYGVVAVLVVAIPSHMAAAGLCVGIIVALLLLSLIKSLALPAPRLWFAAGAVAAGIAMGPVSNLAITGQFAFTPGGTSFLFGRLIEDGIVGRYLNEHCPDPALRICAYHSELPPDADTWLWGNDSAFYKLGGWDGFGAEQAAIISDTLRLYPGMHIAGAASAAVEQFVTLNTEVSTADNDPMFSALKDYAPQLLPQVMSAQQQTGGIDVALLNRLHVPLAALALAGIVAALIWRRRLEVAPELAALCLTVLLALAANAAICGIFSHPVDRYQSRMIPLAAFALALVVARRRQRNLTVAG